MDRTVVSHCPLKSHDVALHIQQNKTLYCTHIELVYMHVQIVLQIAKLSQTDYFLLFAMTSQWYH